MSQEIQTIDMGVIATLTKSEIDQQIATAKAYPRSIDKFQKQARQLATLNAMIAAECIYSVPRDKKKIQGPSVRLAEIIQCCWGNSRAGARIVDEGQHFVTAQGVYHDLESNVAVTYETKRRITTKEGKRYSADMIATTSNAACAIALRNAIFKGIPKAFWAGILTEVQKTIKGDVKNFTARRNEALQQFEELEFTKDEVCKALGLNGVPDITIDHMVEMYGILTALKDGETSKADLLGDTPTKPKAAPKPPTPTQKPEEKKGTSSTDEVKKEFENIISSIEDVNDLNDAVKEYKDAGHGPEFDQWVYEAAKARMGEISA